MDLVQVGTVHTPYARVADCPRWPWTQSVISTLRIDATYVGCVEGVRAGIRAHVLWWAALADRSVTRRHMAAAGPLTGVMASRGVARPNPIGLTLVDVVAVAADGLSIEVRGMDCVTGSPLLDIKPALTLPTYQ
ncbi:TrmO family methyltransferase domain-containing protein [Nocardia jejuensis]|uniref:TrmO family methyltransferase domain-containing protein n=1 Tax=Nocardia jejuensis TaxID=328049 RepID=UPI000AF91671|nr:TrmO family methyltransferase [Nocardia jejuensis]